MTRYRRCPLHSPGDPLCHYPRADTFVGRVELREGPTFGHVSGHWQAAREARRLLLDLALLSLAALVAAILWAVLAGAR